MNKSEIEAMVGQTYGEGKDVRTVTRISDNTVYWKRPGGKERTQGKYLPHFMEWAASLERTASKIVIGEVEEVEDFLKALVVPSGLKGFIRQIDNKVTIQFEILPCSENTNT